jgi:flavin-dependent dehydrogenase
MDTHVAKRTVLIGDAGGFVGVVGHEGLYPAIWGASIAVDVCAEALGARHPQDVLAEFDSRWRREMVVHLNSPNADLRFLLPMVFSNERMARRLANALLGGENL